MPPKRRRGGQAAASAGEADETKEALRVALHNAVNAGVEDAFENISAERERLLSEAREAAAKVLNDAAQEVEKQRRRRL
jgi:hypothetical protein